MKDYTRFILDHRRYYEGLTTENELAVVYANSAVLASRKGHFKYLALAQALAEAGFQYDVLYVGDDILTAGDIAPEKLARYRVVLLPEAGKLTAAQTATLKAYVRQGGRVVAYSATELGRAGSITAIEDDRLLDFWHHYREEGRARVIEPVEGFEGARIRVSEPTVNIVRYERGGEHICHVLDYDYREADDTIVPKEGVEVAIAWAGGSVPRVRWLTLQGEELLEGRLEGSRLSFTIPRVDPYGLAIVG